MIKAFGDISKTKAQKTQFFSTGFPPLDRVISGSYRGGIPCGQIVELFGASQTGKTHLCTEIMISAQKQGGCALYVDWERRFRPDFAERRGLNINPPYFVHTLSPTWEDGNASCIRFAKMIRESGEFAPETPVVVVLDSIAAAIPRSMLEDKTKSGDAATERARSLDYNMSDTTSLARVTSTTLKIIAHYARELNATFVYVNQVREKPGIVYGSNVTTPGGAAMSFYADCRLELTRSMDKDGKDVVGQVVTAKTVKNSITRPMQKVSWTLEYMDDGDTTFDKDSSLIDYLASKDLLESPSKGWYIYNGNKIRKAELIKQSRENGLYDELVKLLKD